METRHKIIVAIRKRPLSKQETQKNEKDIILIQPPNTLIVKELRFPKKIKSRSHQIHRTTQLQLRRSIRRNNHKPNPLQKPNATARNLRLQQIKSILFRLRPNRQRQNLHNDGRHKKQHPRSLPPRRERHIPPAKKPKTLKSNSRNIIFRNLLRKSLRPLKRPRSMLHPSRRKRKRKHSRITRKNNNKYIFFNESYKLWDECEDHGANRHE